MKIYKSSLHLAATFLLIVAPFLFLLFFSKIEQIAVSSLFQDVFASILRLLIAFIIAAILAWVLAVLFYKGPLSHVALPIFDILQSFPEFAILPLAVYYLGRTNFTVIFFLVLTVIWPILFSVLSSLKLVKHDWEEAAEIYQLSGFNYFKKYILPLSIPGLITGSIIGVGEGWGAIVATEIIVNIKGGLGNFFQSHTQSPMITFFGILAVLIIVFSINKLIWAPLLDRSHQLMEE
ncbi:MAG TPA: ABC transporter permease subunit [Methylomirabilota bacterium]|jgi:ABC-type nitrate/sulfonate/bicarbonate transport system permease component|nr:ABC transporter permease subunit [Methylomirabilota bacterium]